MVVFIYYLFAVALTFYCDSTQFEYRLFCLTSQRVKLYSFYICLNNLRLRGIPRSGTSYEFCKSVYAGNQYNPFPFSFTGWQF
jgi:hypothetical protein